MKFEAMDREGKVKMSTEEPGCVYPEDVLRDMEKAGYTFRMDGRKCRAGEVTINFPFEGQIGLYE